MARPSKYNPDFHDAWAWSLASKGATNAQIADAMGISERTLYRWAGMSNSDKWDEEKLTPLGKSLMSGKAPADARVERSLYQRAIGYDYEETETTVEIDKDGNAKNPRRKTVKKKMPPDVMAGMYWLNNRSKKSGEWSQRQEIKVSGINSGPDLGNLTDDQLKAIIAAAGTGSDEQESSS